MTPEESDVIQRLLQHLHQHHQLSAILRVYLFGSRARQQALPRADFDIAIECPTLTDEEWAVMVDIIAETNTLYQLDVSRLEDASADFKQEILEHGVVIYDSSKAHPEYQ